MPENFEQRGDCPAQERDFSPQNKPTTRRAPGKSNFGAFLNRVLCDAEAGRFPISYRSRDCERFNQFPIRLNAAHDSGNVVRLREEILNTVTAWSFLPED